MKILLFWEPIIWQYDSNVLNYIYQDYLDFLTHNFELLFTGYFLFLIGVTGLLLPSMSVLYVLLSVELIFLGINIVFIAIGNLNFIIQMPIYVLLILTLAAAETAVMLSLIFLYHRLAQTTSITFLNKLKF